VGDSAVTTVLPQIKTTEPNHYPTTPS